MEAVLSSGRTTQDRRRARPAHPPPCFWSSRGSAVGAGVVGRCGSVKPSRAANTLTPAPAGRKGGPPRQRSAPAPIVVLPGTRFGPSREGEPCKLPQSAACGRDGDASPAPRSVRPPDSDPRAEPDAPQRALPGRSQKIPPPACPVKGTATAPRPPRGSWMRFKCGPVGAKVRGRARIFLRAA